MSSRLESSARQLAFDCQDFGRASVLLRQLEADSDPCVQQNFVVSEYLNATRSAAKRRGFSPASDIHRVTAKLDLLLECYPPAIKHRSFIMLNLAQCDVVQGNFASAESILRDLTRSFDSLPTCVYLRAAFKLVHLYLNHDLVAKAAVILQSLSALDRDVVTSNLASENDSRMNLQAFEHWLALSQCQVQLASDCLASAMLSLKKAASFVGSSALSATRAGDAMLDRVRVLFAKAHLDLVSGGKAPAESARCQLFETHCKASRRKAATASGSQPATSSASPGSRSKLCAKNSTEDLAFLNNMACAYAMEGKPASAVLLLQKSLQNYAHLIDRSALLPADHILSHLCYNLGVFLHEMGAYQRALDCFVLCLPVLQSRALLWLRMAQCLMALWQPKGEYRSTRDGQSQMNSLVSDMAEAKSFRRGHLYVLPSSKPSHLWHCSSADPGSDEEKIADGDKGTTDDREKNSWRIEWRKRNSESHAFPYYLRKYKELLQYKKRLSKWAAVRKKRISVKCKLMETSIAIRPDADDAMDVAELQQYMTQRQQTLRNTSVPSKLLSAGAADFEFEEDSHSTEKTEATDAKEAELEAAKKAQRKGAIGAYKKALTAEFELKDSHIREGIDRKLAWIKRQPEMNKLISICSKKKAAASGKRLADDSLSEDFASVLAEGASANALERHLEMAELKDLELCVDWLLTAVALFRADAERWKATKKRPTRDDCGLIAAHLSLAFCSLKMRCFELAFGNAQWALDLCHFVNVPLAASSLSKESAMAALSDERAFTKFSPTHSLSGVCEKRDAAELGHYRYLANVYFAESCLNLRMCHKAKASLDPRSLAAKKKKTAASGSTKSKSKAERCRSGKKSEERLALETVVGESESGRNFSRFEEGMAVFDDAQTLKPGDAEYCTMCVNLASCYVCETENLEKAFRWTWAALQKNNSFAPALRMLIYIHLRHGTIRDAIDIIKHRKPVPIPKWASK